LKNLVSKTRRPKSSELLRRAREHPIHHIKKLWQVADKATIAVHGLPEATIAGCKLQAAATICTWAALQSVHGQPLL